MERKLLTLVLAFSMFGAGCIIVDDDDDIDDGGGAPSDGGGGGTGGEVTDGGGGSTNNTNGGGGSGGGAIACEGDDPTGCPESEFECILPTCEEGFCAEVYAAQGSLCSGTNRCDGTGNCLECLTSDDCGAEESCNEAGECVIVDDTLGGACGDNFCALEPASNDCVTCAIAAGQDECTDESVACATDPDGVSCVSCAEWLNGAQGSFCPGSQTKAQNYLNCVCQVGVCAE